MKEKKQKPGTILITMAVTCGVVGLALIVVIASLVIRRTRRQEHTVDNVDPSLVSHQVINNNSVPQSRETTHGRRKYPDEEYAYTTVGDELQDTPTNHQLIAENGASPDEVIYNEDNGYMKMERDGADAIELDILHTDDKDEYIKVEQVREQDYVNTTNADQQIRDVISGRQDSASKSRKLRNIFNNFVDEETLPDGGESVTFRTNEGIKLFCVNIPY